MCIRDSRQTAANVDYYLRNARMISATLRESGFEVWGGESSPYVWARSADCSDSWAIFRHFLHDMQISCTPGIGFGRLGEGFIRLTGFNTHEKTEEAMRRIADWRAMQQK